MFDWIVSVIEALGYPGVLLLMLAENLFPPIPSEVIMPLAGFLAADGRMSLPVVIVLGTIGSVAGTAVWYWVGARLGAERLKRWAARHGRWLTVSPSDIDSALDWFNRHGRSAIFFGRMIPAIRTLISVPAGVARMPLTSFLALTTAGSAIWTTALAVAGMLLRENYDRVSHVVDPASKLVVGAVVVLYLYRVITWKPH